MSMAICPAVFKQMIDAIGADRESAGDVERATGIETHVADDGDIGQRVCSEFADDGLPVRLRMLTTTGGSWDRDDDDTGRGECA